MDRPFGEEDEAEIDKRAKRRGRAIALAAVVMIGALVLCAGVLLQKSRGSGHPGDTPALVAQRTRLPSCGSYNSQPLDLAGGKPTPRPPTTHELAVNRCLLAAYQAGKPAEIRVTTPEDDIQMHYVYYFRVLGGGKVEWIVEHISKSGKPFDAYVNPFSLPDTDLPT